jgi:hypothetical protein
MHKVRLLAGMGGNFNPKSAYVALKNLFVEKQNPISKIQIGRFVDDDVVLLLPSFWSAT